MRQPRGSLVGFRLEWKPADYCFYTPEDYAREICREGARTWGLYTEPQAGCSPEVAVYRGPHWIQPKYVHNKDLVGFMPLYVGPVLNEPQIDESVLFAFPSITESKMQREHPHLFPA